MKRKVVIRAIIILFCLSMLVGCDPIYPPGELKVARIEPITQGDSINIEIIYPYIGGSSVCGWKDQNIEIVSGNDIVVASGLTLTGIKSGTATIKVNATTAMYDEAIKSGYEEKVNSSSEIEIKVK